MWSTLHERFLAEEIDRISGRPVDSNFLRELATLDFSFFAHFYLPEHFYSEDAPFHREFARDIERLVAASSQGVRGHVAEIWARDHAKTTWATLALPLWCGVTGKKLHIPIVSDAQGQSEEFLATIRHEATENEALLEDFGVLKGPVWRDDRIILTTGTKIVPYGARQKLRGRKHGARRPDLVICDDLEDDIAVVSETQRERLRRWIMRVILKLGSTYTLYVFLGSLLHQDCHMAHLMVNPGFYVRRYPAVKKFAEREDLWAQWRELYADLDDLHRRETAEAFFLANQEEMLEGAEVAWERLGYYYLMEELIVGGRAAFSREMQCQLRVAGEGFFKELALYHSEEAPDGEVWLVPHTGAPRVRLSDCRITGFCDPALGRSASSSFAAVTAVAKAPTGRVFVIDSLLTRRPTDWVIDYIVRLCTRLRIARLALENVAFQGLFLRDLVRALKAAGLEGSVSLRGVPRPPGSRQEKRIESLQPAIDNAWILFNEDHQRLNAQVEEFPDATFKDGPDSLEGAVSEAGGAGGASLISTGSEVVSAASYQFGVPGGRRSTPTPVPMEYSPERLIRTEEECLERLAVRS